MLTAKTFHFDPPKPPSPRKAKAASHKLYGKESIARYQALHEQQFKKKYPSAYKDGLYSFDTPTGKQSNKLTAMVKNALEWMGHECNRIDTKGTAVVNKKGKPKYSVVSGSVEYQTTVNFIPTNTKRGTEDLSARLVHNKTPFGTPWAIEIKIKDSQSEYQEGREIELKSKGMWYDIVRSLDEFWNLYDEKIRLLDGL